ncbi:MAG: CHASE3 domain-containing protein [Betaproteobacteria bacterium]
MKSTLSLKIVIPLVLGIIASLAIAVYAELGYRRLELANKQMAVALEMQAVLHEMLALVVDAENGQRGFLLTGNNIYLEPYESSLKRVDGAFDRLQELLVAHGTAEQRITAARFNNLVGRKLSELEVTIALYRKEGPEAALALFNTGVGKRSMDEVRSSVDNMEATHKQQLASAAARWTDDIAFARLGMQLMTVFTVSLLLIVWLLARRDAQQREARRVGMQLDKVRLEALVEERTAELSELSNHLQVVREEEKGKLARDIHDELGGILVSAKMDVAWVENRLKGRDPEAAVKLERALLALDDGVQIKRRIIEELRPTLLDNLGLSAALDWQVHQICDRAGLQCTIETAEDDAAITPNVAIALYRIVQEALTNIVKYARAQHVMVDMGVTDSTVTLVIEDDGIGIRDGAQNNRLSHGITGMRQRVKALNGEFSVGRGAKSGTLIQVNIPLDTQPVSGHEPAVSA